ncbi:hypothetical protein LTR28_008620, partial [Elasticomyces elasticus]
RRGIGGTRAGGPSSVLCDRFEGRFASGGLVVCRSLRRGYMTRGGEESVSRSCFADEVTDGAEIEGPWLDVEADATAFGPYESGGGGGGGVGGGGGAVL